MLRLGLVCHVVCLAGLTGAVTPKVSLGAESPEKLMLQPPENENDKGPARPFWVFDMDAMWNQKAANCCMVMAAAGVLCAAGGIGGGGIYVTVLMVAGGLSVRDAVPLSKAVVFIGSISSLFLNLRKATSTRDGLIDYNVCRLVVPAALVGTYMGVILNSIVPGWAVLMALVGILLAISYMVLQTTWSQYADEEHIAEHNRKTDYENAKKEFVPEVAAWKSSQEVQEYTKTDIALSAVMLAVVITGSAFRHHALNCQSAPEQNRLQVCHHPTLFWLEANTLMTWMQTPSTAAFIKVFFFAGPMIFCITVLACVAAKLVRVGWSPALTVKFSIMSVTTGCLAGFVGIGGGLIFSPYFLLMGLEPAVAVATSSTCVIFTASSTTFQYLLTDRIIMSLMLVYGLVNLVSSYAGTSLVHYLQDQLSTRRSYISGIVSAGVVISTLLAVRELIYEAY
ncbi:unnamed protein product [Effrenium voratum]|uniref:Sulfite exporter TauE/SafE n=1 Tax=Effrenium voratum TaxID=2562239 RepID=A0AA36HVM7_9DINO|nr:unnamed protein product [Effrenium voratum]CAJ1376174.1 unnamed protein product [Effrenium voratum]CAJ1415347.1 unnamed protein product [Effrenium voratum]